MIKKLTEQQIKELQQKYPTRETNHFMAHYITWRPKRINKLVSILGKEWFKNKQILELGCGYGHISAELQKLGAIVSCAEGREDQIPEIIKRVNNVDMYILDQDKNWKIDKQFDLVINWGVSYHLDDWRQDLKCSIEQASIVTLESEILDPYSKIQELKFVEGWFESALNGIGNRVSTKLIEECILESNATFVRYDDTDLDCWNTTHGGLYEYSWKDGERIHEKEYEYIPGLRRFWMIYKNDK